MKCVHLRILSISLVLFLSLATFLSAGGAKEQGEQKTPSIGEQYTWTTEEGTFVLSKRIADKIANNEKLIIKNSTLDPACPYSGDVRRGISRAEEEFGIDYKMIGPTDAVLEKQVEELETIIKLETTDGLVIASGDVSTMEPILKLAWEKGIPVTTYDVDTPGSPRLAYVGSINVDVGRVGGEAFVKLHPQKTGNIALLACHVEGIYARERFKGFMEVLERENYNLDIIGPFSVGIDMNEAYGVVENTFLANPGIEAVYFPDEYVVMGAEYVKRNNLKGKVIVQGVNDFSDILQHVKNGYIQQTVGNSPAGQGYMGAKIIYEFLTTGKTTPEMMLVNLDSINQENVDEFLEH